MSGLVVGIGNPWRGDDAAGLTVARRVAGAVEYEGDPSGLIDLWEGHEEVTLIDAVRSGAPPGTVHRIDLGAGTIPSEYSRHSTHHLGLAASVELARTLDRLPPRIELIGIEAGDFIAGAPLSRAVRAAVDAVSAQLARGESPAGPHPPR